jgi:hypothetical protein
VPPQPTIQQMQRISRSWGSLRAARGALLIALVYGCSEDSAGNGGSLTDVGATASNGGVNPAGSESSTSTTGGTSATGTGGTATGTGTQGTSTSSTGSSPTSPSTTDTGENPLPGNSSGTAGSSTTPESSTGAGTTSEPDASTGGPDIGAGGAPNPGGSNTGGDGGDDTDDDASDDDGGQGGDDTGGGGAPNNEGGAGSGNDPELEIDPDAIYVAPDGDANAAGTLDDPTTLQAALSSVGAGDTVYLLGGSYPLGSTIGLSANGSADAVITLSAYPLDDTRPRLDFSQMSEDSGNRGLSLSGDYWHVYGLDVFSAGDNCMFVSGSNNSVEFSTFSECADTGLQLGNGAANNLVLNCDSFFNADSSLENADGFAAKLDVGTGNKFVGCRAWNNLDDGWDGYLRPADGVTTTYERCWAIDNGKLKDGGEGAGDGNGFKSGGSDDKDLRHNAIYTQCIAAGNVHDGFDHNSNRGEVTILNSAAHDNGANINFSSSNIAAKLTVKNTLSVGERGELEASSTDIANNSWQDGLEADAEDFVSLDMSALKAPRKPDGSLPDIDYLRLTPGSDLKNAGVDIGLPFADAAPDIGPFESNE